MSNSKTKKAAKSAGPGGNSVLNSKLVENVAMSIEAYIGETRMTLAELSELSPGDVIELDAALNTLVELRIDDIVVAQGELVSVGDKFGVRVSAIEP